MENFFNNERILKSFWRWKMHIAIVSLLAIVISTFISSSIFITPKYKSTGKIYPVNTQLYSEESESEQLIENIRSADIKFKLIDAFQLDEIYKIKRNDPLYKTYILAELNKNISFKKTEFETVEIKVLDKDPQRASDMVDSLCNYYNQSQHNQHAIKYFEVAHIAMRDLKLKNDEIDSISTKLSLLSQKYDLLNFPLQVESTTSGLMEAAARGGNARPAQKMLQNLKIKGIEFDRLQKQLNLFQHISDSLKSEYDWAISNGTKKISYSIIVEKPFPADKKSYPVRWLIVFLSTLATFLASVVTISVIDYKHVAKE